MRFAWNESHTRECDNFAKKIEQIKVERGNQQAMPRQEPSRLEIAAMLKAGWFANQDADFHATDHKWWLEQADKLIAAAKQAK